MRSFTCRPVESQGLQGPRKLGPMMLLRVGVSLNHTEFGGRPLEWYGVLSPAEDGAFRVISSPSSAVAT